MEVAAPEARIEPVTAGDGDEGRPRLPRLRHQPFHAHAIGIGAEEIGGVGLGPVGDDLDVGHAAGLHPLAEAMRDDDDAAFPVADQGIAHRRDGPRGRHVEIGGPGERGGEAERFGAAVLIDQRDPHPARVQRHRIAEQEQEERRQDEGDDEGGGIARDLDELLHHQRAETADVDHAASLSSRCASERSMSAIKASSIVGSSMFAILPASAFNASGVPLAIWRAR
jgi:hypothetical protein